MEENKYTTGFKIPTDYFETFEDRLLHKISEETLPKETGFGVPDGYFDYLEKAVLQNVEPTLPKVIPLYKKSGFITTVSIAACLALIFTIVGITQNNSITLNDINDETIGSYIDEGNIDLSPQDIALLLEDEDVYSLSEPSEDISKESLTDYLLNNIDDPNLLFD